MKQAIFVINLPNRTDRRAEMTEQLARVGWNAEFFAAIRPDDMGEFSSIGARGCFMSHLGVLKEAKKRNLDRLILLEDDLNFSNDFSEHWESALAFLDANDWSIFYPAHYRPGADTGPYEVPSEQHLLCTHFMVFNGPVIGPLIELLELILTRPYGHPLGSPMHVDGAYTVIRKHNPQIITYGHNPALGYQRLSASDISTRWIDKIGGMAPLVRIARRVKQKIMTTTQTR